MKQEFNLSDKIISKTIYENTEDKIKVSRVKEFIKILEDKLKYMDYNYSDAGYEAVNILRNLAGEKLLK